MNNRCYGSDRIRDLVVMRALLKEQHQLVPKVNKDGSLSKADWGVNKFDFASWKRRGATSGGPKPGTWPFHEGHKVTRQGQAGTFTVQRGDQDLSDDADPNGKLLVSADTGQEDVIDDSLTSSGAVLLSLERLDSADSEVSRTECDFAAGFDFDRADSNRNKERRKPYLPAGRKELRTWANGPITIAGSLFIAVPHANSVSSIAQAMSPLPRVPTPEPVAPASSPALTRPIPFRLMRLAGFERTQRWLSKS